MVSLFVDTSEKVLLSQLVWTKHGPLYKQLDLQVGSLENKRAFLEDWQLLVDLSLKENKVPREAIMDRLPKHKDLWSGCLGSMKTTHHTIDLTKGTRHIRTQTFFCARISTCEVLC